MAKVHVCFNGSPEELRSILARQLCLVFYSGGCPSVCLDGQTRALFLKLLPSSCLSPAFKHSTSPGFECCVHLA